MTLEEYLYKTKAHKLSRIDKRQELHLKAWLGRNVIATETINKKESYVFKTFKQFFDYEKELKEIDSTPTNTINEKQKRLAYIAMELNNNQ